LTRIEYFGRKRNPKQMCENPRRHVGSTEYIILRYYPPRRQVTLTGKRYTKNIITRKSGQPSRKVTGQINIYRGRLGSFVHSLSLKKPETVRKFGGGGVPAVVWFSLV
jgi:hypothetical protein